MNFFQYILGKCSIIILTLCYITGVTVLLYNYIASPLTFSSCIGLIVTIILIHPIEEAILNFLSKYFEFYKKLKEKDQ